MTPTVWVMSGPSSSLAQNTGFILARSCDHTGSLVIAASSAPESTAERLAPMPPAGTICTLLRSMLACFSDISISMLLTEPGEVKPTRLPRRSLIPVEGESAFAIHRRSRDDFARRH